MTEVQLIWLALLFFFLFFAAGVYVGWMLRKDENRLAAHRAVSGQLLAAVQEAYTGIIWEYEFEYNSAQVYAAIQIWASIQRHAGDPRWEYVDNGELAL